MKKFGFTLAEVLITLGIIGIVAALTTPALFHNVATADIGPRLQKFRSTLEEANKRILIENDVNRLSVLLNMHINDPAGPTAFYTNQLRNFMRIDRFDRNGAPYTALNYDGTNAGQARVSVSQAANNNTLNINFAQNTLFDFRTVEGMGVQFVLDNNLNDSVGVVLIDTNGDAIPNRIGKDIFGFAIDNFGMLTPLGSPSIAVQNTDDWNTGCISDSDANFNALTCTASIFANNRRVVYQE